MAEEFDLAKARAVLSKFTSGYWKGDDYELLERACDEIARLQARNRELSQKNHDSGFYLRHFKYESETMKKLKEFHAKRVEIETYRKRHNGAFGTDRRLDEYQGIVATIANYAPVIILENERLESKLSACKEALIKERLRNYMTDIFVMFEDPESERKAAEDQLEKEYPDIWS
jgi:hypothetical protein